MSSYDKIMEGASWIPTLDKSKIEVYNDKLAQLREVMKLINRPYITLSTSEPIGPGQDVSHGGKFNMIVGASNVRLIGSNNQVTIVNDGYLKSCHWFNVYIYIVEMELEMTKIYNHISDSISVREGLNGRSI